MVESRSRPSSSSTLYQFDDEDIDDEFQCSICWNLMYQPVTTPCGHTFCKFCLHQALQRKRECLLCRVPIFQSSIENLPVNIMLQNILEKKYPKTTLKLKEVALVKQKEEEHKRQQQEVSRQYPILITGAHVFKGMTASITLKGDRYNRFMIGLQQQINHTHDNNLRQLVIMKSESDMVGFRVDLIRLTAATPSPNTANTPITCTFDVVGVCRFRVQAIIGCALNDQQLAEAALMAGLEVPQFKTAVGQPLCDIQRAGLIEEGASQEDMVRLRDGYNSQLLQHLKDLKALFIEKQQQKISQESFGDPGKRRGLIHQITATWGPEPLITVNERNGQIDTIALQNQAEAFSIYALSQLELQNDSRSTLVFGQDVDERIRACIQEMQLSLPYQRLFVWEMAPVEKKEKSFEQLKLLLLFAGLLFLCGIYRTYYK